ncbi:MAG: methyltransferase domain-containing protein [Anaerolineales bacterium]|nr:methyltransferase domain-containing protein [Anaerolineales bacterium]
MTESTTRAEREIEHGRKLSAAGAEDVWGWGTPAGQVRAQRRAATIARAAGLTPGMRVLEIGCGTGNFTEKFAAYGAQIIALDISEELLTEARRRGLPDVTFLCQPFETLGSAEAFDAILGSSILHHLEIGPALQEILRLLRPGGVMSFAEPNMANPQIMLQKNVRWIGERLGESPDETAFFRGALGRLMRRVGFVDVCIAPRDWLHPSTSVGMIPFVQKLEAALESVPLVRSLAGSLYISARRPVAMDLR